MTHNSEKPSLRWVKVNDQWLYKTRQIASGSNPPEGWEEKAVCALDALAPLAGDAPLGGRYCSSAPTGWELQTRLRPKGRNRHLEDNKPGPAHQIEELGQTAQ